MDTSTPCAQPAPELAEERERCWRRLVDLVAWYQAGNTAGVIRVLREVAEAKGRPTADKLKDQVLQCARAESWRGCDAWRNNNFQPTKDSRYAKRRW